MVDLETPPLQFHRDPAVTVGRRLERDLLQRIAYFHFDRRGLLREAPPIIARPADPGHLTQRIHRFAFRGCFADFLEQATAPLTTAGG